MKNQILPLARSKKITKIIRTPRGSKQNLKKYQELDSITGHSSFKASRNNLDGSRAWAERPNDLCHCRKETLHTHAPDYSPKSKRTKSLMQTLILCENRSVQNLEIPPKNKNKKHKKISPLWMAPEWWPSGLAPQVASDLNAFFLSLIPLWILK